MQNEIVELYLDDIIPNRFQPREKFDEEALKELSTSIKEHGVIQPIIVRKIGEKYEIIAGERRYKASALAGLTKIPAIIRNLDDKEASKVALLENLQRKDLTAIEEARTYQKILELDSMTQEELGKTMGKSQAAIANKLRLLALTDEVQEALLNDQISERHARSLLNLENANEQVEMLNRIIRSRMTVRELDQEIKNIKRGEQTTLPLENNEPIKSENFDLIKEEAKPLTLEDLLKTSSFNNPTSFEHNPQIQPKMIPQQEETIAPTFNKNQFIPPIEPEEEIKPISLDEIEDLDTSKSQETVINEENQEFIQQFKLKDAINLVRNIVPEITQKGIEAHVEEFDLGGKYQIIINISKDDLTSK